MKVFFEKIFKLDQEYQEILIDENNFSRAIYKQVPKSLQSINGLRFEDVFVLEPKNYYKFVLKNNTPHDFNNFSPASSLIDSGLIVSDINKKTMCFYVYNSTHNHIYVRSNAVIGEIE